ncbi:aspartate aminotransferase family protein [Tunicatimonas pelagia]|uniref:aspartate aminotransferase family protein n=1 Tax=Tunicatimonas pelagia TaxID=931531 RepID=UPI0026668CAA|nr:aspartate aminotransferase family protein [Tunicatimonas pelagia]WKN41090.1 aspartate aminotransferase family protein [Tunicatimonas pelagia]
MNLTELDQQYYLPVFNRYPITLAKGEGSRLWDTDGKEYVDMLAGIAVTSVGHCHPKVVEAIRQQAGQLMHVSNLLLTEPQAELTQTLAQFSGMDRIFLSNSGAEAVEGAVKIARKYAHAHDRGGTIITFEGAFHGRTLATAAAGSPKYQEGYEPIPSGFVKIPYNDIEALEKAYSDDATAVLVEPVQWAEGIRVAQLEFLQAVRQWCDEHNIVLIFDEIQCGVGRTGKAMAWQRFGVKPDVITMAKALGSGFPIGATLCVQKIADALNKGDHGSTFGGNPLACATALATLAVIKEENLAQQAEVSGSQLMGYLCELSAKHPAITQVSGMGLMIGAKLNQPARPVAERMLKHGVIASAVGKDTIRFVPALNAPWEDLKQGADALVAALADS